MSTIGELLDPGALAIVVAGTVLATAARCGWRDLGTAARTVFGIGHEPFDEDANKVAMAQTASAVSHDGPLCAQVPMPPDPSLAMMVDAYVRHSSLEALHSVRRAERTAREITRQSAVRVFEYAGELAPVFGLVGTLFSITQMMPGAGEVAAETFGAITTAVLSTLYGVLFAHLFCIPVARRIERAGEREEAAREEIADWLVRHLRRDDVKSNARLRGVA